jgi:hypothetical protein
VIPTSNAATMLVGSDRSSRLVELEHLDGVAVGRDDVEREDPSRPDLTGRIGSVRPESAGNPTRPRAT